ncbi:MAG: Hsp20/alpha crystallin family protein [Candidatus Heimdallarchaeota archaeon]|nr:Hsp20/alpha crystallin family protein [Candidatus Heimdallarchaeota archaeon]
MKEKKEKKMKKDVSEGEIGHSKDVMIKKDYPLMFFDEIDRMMDNIRSEMFSNGWDSFKGFMLPKIISRSELDEVIRRPLSNISSDEENYYIKTEIPGLDKNDVEITIRNNIVRIEGKAKESNQKEDEDFIRKESHSTRYYRSYTLPENVEIDKVEASLDKGILELIIPKSSIEASEEKKIEIS